MNASVQFLSALVIVATVAATIAPIVLAVLWFRDWRGGRLW